MMTPAETKRAAARERQQLRRERKMAGIMVLRVYLSRDDLEDLLARVGCVQGGGFAAEMTDLEYCGSAVERLLEALTELADENDVRPAIARLRAKLKR
jgi:hypothetical protein